MYVASARGGSLTEGLKVKGCCAPPLGARRTMGAPGGCT